MAVSLASPKTRGGRSNGGGLLSSEEFLDWLQAGVFADLIDGQISMHSPVNLRHATLVNFLDHLLRSYLEEAELGGVLHRESVAVRLSARETFMPDIGWFTAAQALRIGESHASFAPTFVVEALSPATAKNDTGPKFASYELHDVQEYWILDPQHQAHRFYRRAGDMLEEFANDEAKIVSSSIRGFWVKRAWLDPVNPPKVSACLKEIMRAGKKH
jgi:Uma2 family endonuclease